MKINQRKWSKDKGWEPASTPDFQANFVLVFGSHDMLAQPGPIGSLRKEHPAACILGCSTAGEILGTQVFDDTLVVSEILLEHSQLRQATVALSQTEDSRSAGSHLGRQLPHALPESDGGSAPLVHVFMVSDGLAVNGSLLARGLVETLPEGVTVTGGLAGDGTRFNQTFVVSGEQVASGLITAVGLYGRRLKIGYASLGGWDSFGAERLITHSKGNVLYELDGQSVLGLYKSYLGDKAADLPASGLLFPLSLRNPEGGHSVVRTLLAIDEKEQTTTFAGDVPEGFYARLMMANFDRLIDGAVGAAQKSKSTLGNSNAELAILISCVGRKLVLRQRVEEEIEGVSDVLGHTTALTGFYSYGEICPFEAGGRCELHNQTMTITLLTEI